MHDRCLHNTIDSSTSFKSKRSKIIVLIVMNGPKSDKMCFFHRVKTEGKLTLMEIDSHAMLNRERKTTHNSNVQTETLIPVNTIGKRFGAMSIDVLI